MAKVNMKKFRASACSVFFVFVCCTQGTFNDSNMKTHILFKDRLTRCRALSLKSKVQDFYSLIYGMLKVLQHRVAVSFYPWQAELLMMDQVLLASKC